MQLREVRDTYMIYLGLGILLYWLVPSLARAGNLVLFVATFYVILSMYGGGFATIPAYLRDIFGTLQVGAIHRRLLTAWSVAGVAGPSIVTYIREAQIERGVAKADAYSMAIYIMVGVLAIGFLCNLLARPVHERHHHKPASPSAPAAAATDHEAERAWDASHATAAGGGRLGPGERAPGVGRLPNAAEIARAIQLRPRSLEIEGRLRCFAASARQPSVSMTC
jgi:hypothetical protein